MAFDQDRSPRPDYHLDLAFEGSRLLLNVDGPEGPVLQRHIAEVRRAAERCGLRVVVNGDDRPGMPA